jgi:hypothetical protein
VGVRIQRAEIPTAAEVAERERELLAERVLAVLNEDRWRRLRPVIEELATDRDPVDLAAAALTLAEQARGDGARGAGESSASAELEEWLRRPRREPAAQGRPGRGRPFRPGPPRRRPPFAEGQHRYKPRRRPY